MITFAIFYTPQIEPNPLQRFSMVRTDEEGHPAIFGPCAKKLSQKAFAAGADLVRHGYNLVHDDCEEHTTRRFKGA